ncbi:UDP-glucuronosyltransferase 1A1-like [Lineus longissimus]|uniref:UDP-glucuronosyltransferase 1A1-like n=1 Tax=Lineus longissimus TaxID=88925 RepID=UPI002B4E1074
MTLVAMVINCEKRVVIVMLSALTLFNRIHGSTTKKVLVLAPSARSHLMQANSVTDGLIDRGHDVHTIVDVRLKLPADFLHPKVKVINYDNGVDVIFNTPEYQVDLVAMGLKDMSVFERLNLLSKLYGLLTGECHRVLGNVDLFDKLQREKFDFVVIDGFMKCFSIFPHRLGVPFVSFQSFLPFDIPHAALQGPLLIRGPFDGLLTGEDSPALLATTAKVFLVLAGMDASAEYYRYSNKTILELQKEAKLWLYDKSLLVDSPMPVSPNVIRVGGLNIRRPKPLTEGKLKHFTDSAEDGFILVCFGSFVQHFPDKVVDTLIESFKNIRYKVVWKWNKSSLLSREVPNNVLVVDWIPQNDILGHRNIKLFVTHCGGSGLHEALYSGVPMLAIPLFGDQVMNAKTITTLHFGLNIRMKDLTKSLLVSSINSLVSDVSFSRKIGAASRIFRDQPMDPRQTAAYWIEHVMKYGADHLQSKTNEMSWFRILMMDVLFVVCVVFLVLCVLIAVVCHIAFRKCCLKSKPKLKTKIQ